MGYRIDIDGLRGIAILLVALFHFDLIPGIDGGFVGVDIFFVISGYLISTIIWRQLEEGRFTLGGFYLRRFRRLAPAFICVQLLLIAFGYLYLLPSEVSSLAKQSLAAQIYVINVYFWRTVNYFAGPAHAISLLHVWSLAVEEQFYLLYPFLLLAAFRYGRRQLPIILAVVAAGSFLLNLIGTRIKPEATFYLLPTRAWELMLGGLILFVQPWFETRRTARILAGVVGLGLVAAAAGLYRTSIPFPGVFALLPTVGAMGLILSGTGAGSAVSRLVSVRPLVLAGQISYSFYLVHWPIKVFASIFVVKDTLALHWASMALSIVLASALYLLVENPFRRGLIFARPRRFVLAYGASVALVFVLMGSALVTKGWPRRFNPEVERVASYVADQDDGLRVCDYHPDRPLDPAGPCHLGKPGAPASWAVIGDSHAWALASAFSTFLQRRDNGGVLAFAHACMPVQGLGPPSCQAFSDGVFDWIKRNPSVRNVVLVSIWRQPFEGLLEGPDHQSLAGDAAKALFQEQLSKTLRDLRQAGKSTYVWEPVVPAKKDVPNTLARNMAFGWHLDIAPGASEHEETFKFLRTALDANRDLINGRISPAARMCKGAVCEIADAQGPLFYDNNHPARSRADYYSQIIEAGLGGHAQFDNERAIKP
jgi:peptidoglycan/LPS O-acetylase OafA/YrhL